MHYSADYERRIRSTARSAGLVASDSREVSNRWLVKDGRVGIPPQQRRQTVDNYRMGSLRDDGTVAGGILTVRMLRILGDAPLNEECICASVGL